MKNGDLKKRILDISYKHGLSHLSSCLTSVDIIDEIYANKDANDIFVLSSGHAGLALYVVLEKYHGLDAEVLFEKHGVHPNRDVDNFIYCSSGSLGHGIGIALGMALADKTRDVDVLISDGEANEGSVYESLALANDLGVDNLYVALNYNGYSAMSELRIPEVVSMWPNIKLFDQSYIYKEFPLIGGIQGHYRTLTEDDYKEMMGCI